MRTAPKIDLIDIEALRDDPRNARVHSEGQVEELAAAILKWGWTSPALVDLSADNLIVAGHGRKAAASLLTARGEAIRLPNGKPLPAGKVPFVDVSGWSDEDRRAYALADNQLALRADWDVGKLSEELDALASLDVDVGLIGFDEAALAELDQSLALVESGGGGSARGQRGGDLADSEFVHVDRWGVVVECESEDQQRELYERLHGEGLNAKVVTV